MITNLKSAVKHVCRTLKQIPIAPVRPINDGKYTIVPLKEKKIMVAFKRKPFLTYGRGKEGTGFGDSINKVNVLNCDLKGIKDIYIVYTDEKIYHITTTEILNNCEERTTLAEGKETCSFDMKLLGRVINE